MITILAGLMLLLKLLPTVLCLDACTHNIFHNAALCGVDVRKGASAAQPPVNKNVLGTSSLERSYATTVALVFTDV